MTTKEFLDASPVPTESQEQQRLFQWAKMEQGYEVALCIGWEKAAEIIRNYLIQ